MEDKAKEHLVRRAEQIYGKIFEQGPQQVRIDGDRVLSFKYPAPRGYGVRGMLIGVYGKGVDFKWLLEDLMSFAPNASADESGGGHAVAS